MPVVESISQSARSLPRSLLSQTPRRGQTAMDASEKNEKPSVEKHEDADSDTSAKVVQRRDTGLHLSEENINAKLANPLNGIPQDQLLSDAESFAKEHGLGHLVDEIRKGALVAQDPLGFESMDYLSEDDKIALRRELTHRWDQPKTLYWLVVMCSVAAAVQGVSNQAYTQHLH